MLKRELTQHAGELQSAREASALARDSGAGCRFLSTSAGVTFFHFSGTSIDKGMSRLVKSPVPVQNSRSLCGEGERIVHFGAPQGRLLALLVLLFVALGPVAQASVQSELAFHRGVIAYGEERWDEAKQHFDRVLEEDSDDSAALHYLALIADAQDDPDAALAYYGRAIAVDPEDADVLLDRGALLLEQDRIAEARDSFQRVIELDPDNARAQLLAGMAAYRAGDHAASKPYLARAGELDPSLRDDARYYTGLSEAVLGNVDAAASAFNDAATQSPLSSIGKSAQNFAQALEQGGEPARPWRASLAAGMEFDSNPLVRGNATTNVPLLRSRNSDGRGVIRPSASYRFIDDGAFRMTAGYDGYLSFHIDANDANLQNHNPWLAGSYDLGPARLGLRYDYAFSTIDRAEPLRHLHRVTPSVTFQEGGWGATLLYYQLHVEDFLNSTSSQPVFDRDGLRHVPGITQFFFLPEPFTYVRIGVEGDFLNTDGTEFKRDAIEASFGAGYDFPYEISLAWLYQFEYRDFDNASAFSNGSVPVLFMRMPPVLGFTTQRKDYEHRVTAEVSKFVTKHLEASLAMGLTFNDSNISFYDYDRYVGGAYLTYHF